MTPYQLGLLAGAIGGSIFIGLLVSRALRKILRSMSPFTADAVAMLFVGTGGAAVRLSTEAADIGKTFAFYMVSAAIAFVLLQWMRSAVQLATTRYKPENDTPVRRTKLVFHRLGVVLAAILFVLGAGLGMLVGAFREVQYGALFSVALIVAAVSIYLLAWGIGWIVSAAFGDR